MSHILINSVVIPFPKTETPDGPRVILIRPGCYDAEKYSVLETFKVSSMIFEILMREDDNYIVGGQVISENMNISATYKK